MANATYNNYLEYMTTGLYNPIIKAQWLRNDETPESEFSAHILDGSLTENLNDGVRKSIDLQLYNKDGIYIPNPDTFWIGKKIKIFIGYDIPNKGKIYFPKGVFVCAKPSLSSKGRCSELSLSASDKFSLYNGEIGGTLLNTYEISVNSNLNTAIRQILSQENQEIKMPKLQSTTMTTPYTIRKNGGNTYGDLLKELSFAMGERVYFDNDGILTTHSIRKDSVKPILWDYNYHEKFTYQSAKQDYKWNEVVNVVKVIGATINGNTAIGIAKNEDLSSPICIQKIGVKTLPSPIEDDVIQTDAEAQKRAEYELRKRMGVATTISISSIPLPHLEVNNAITTTDDNLGNKRKRHIINQINTNFGSKTMTVNGIESTDTEIVTN